MNLFFLDEDPRKCAEYHADQHVNKLIVECAQVLCTAHWKTGSKAPYRPSHVTHPISKWVRTSLTNYYRACEYGMQLAHEALRRRIRRKKSRRFNKAAKVIAWCYANPPNIPDIGPTPIYQAFSKFKHLRIPNDPIQAYRNYYIHAKSRFATWKHSTIPAWYLEGIKRRASSTSQTLVKPRRAAARVRAQERATSV